MLVNNACHVVICNLGVGLELVRQQVVVGCKHAAAPNQMPTKERKRMCVCVSSVRLCVCVFLCVFLCVSVGRADGTRVYANDEWHKTHLIASVMCERTAKAIA